MLGKYSRKRLRMMSFVMNALSTCVSWGQGSEVNVPIHKEDFNSFRKEEVRRLFDDIYEKLYGRTYPESEVKLINFTRASLPEKDFYNCLNWSGGRGIPAISGSSGSAPRLLKFTFRIYLYTANDRYKVIPRRCVPGSCHY